MRDQAEKLRQLIKNNTMNQELVRNNPDYSGKTRVITVTSGKGGVGKTNVTVNLALALAKLERKVLILDADLGTANVDVILGCSSKYSILSLMEDGVTPKDVVADGPWGIKFVSGGSGIYQLANLSEPQLEYLIGQIGLLDNIADIILIDTGAGLNRNVIRFVTAADEVVIVTTPEPTAITDAYAMMKAYAANGGTAPLKLVVNRVVEPEEGQLVVDKLIKVAYRFLGLPIESLGFVYDDANLVKAVKKQSPLLLAFPDTIAARCIKHIAHRLLFGEQEIQVSGIKGFFRKFLNMMR